MSAKKVIIPKGIINPNETSVIEIPNELQGSSVVVARNHTGSSGSSGSYRGASQFGSSSSGGYRGASMFGNSSGAYRGASQFSGGSGAGSLNPPSPPCIPECNRMRPPVSGGDSSPMATYGEFRHGAGGITSSPFAAIMRSDRHDPEFEQSVAEQMSLLNNLDFVEYDQLMEDLNSFHRYRRRLEQDLSNMGYTSASN